MAKNFSKKRFGMATLLIIAGSILLLKNLNLLPFEIPAYVFTWKMLLVAIGLIFLLKNRWFGGLLMIAIGSYFLLPEAFGIHIYDAYLFWPALLILMGILILTKPKFKKKKESNQPENQNINYMENTVIFGGDSKQVSSYDFEGGKITTIFGGLEMDLTNCYLSKENKVIDLFVVFGGVTLKVPKEWNVKTEVIPVMGGVGDNIHTMPDTYIDPAAELLIKGTVILGGLEIKRV